MLNDSEREKLQKLFHEHGLICRVLSPETERTPSAQVRKDVQQEQQEAVTAAARAHAAQQKAQEMVVINRTLRGGQEIRTKSSVMVCGNVNPGAQIIVVAAASIFVRSAVGWPMQVPGG